MIKSKNTTSNSLQFKLQEQLTTNNGVGESFRVLYYGTTSSVPFVWESQPGTPKHALTESSLPPLTPPPSYYHLNQNLTNNKSSNRSSFLRTIFVNSSRKRNMSAQSFSSSSVSSSSSSASSYLHSSQSTPTRKKEARSMLSPVKFGLEDEYTNGCLGGGFKKGCRVNKVKKVMMSFVRIGKELRHN